MSNKTLTSIYIESEHKGQIPNLSEFVRNAINHEIQRKKGLIPENLNTDELNKLLEENQNKKIQLKNELEKLNLEVNKVKTTEETLLAKLEEIKKNKNWQQTYKKQLLQIKNETNPELQKDYCRSLSYALDAIGITIAPNNIYNIAINTQEE